MTTTLTRPGISAVSQALAAEIRAESARRGVSGRELARRMGMTQPKISRRIGMSADVELTVEDVAEMAEALGISAEGLITAALRARRDSNPKPSDWESAAPAWTVNRRLTLDSRYREAWGLAS